MLHMTKWLVAGALLFPALVFANEASTTQPRPVIKDAMHARVEMRKDSLQEKRASTTEAIKAKREEFKNAVAEKRGEILTDLKAKREEFSSFFKQRLASTTEMIKERRAALKDEIQKRRGEIIERYYGKVAEIFRMRIDRLSGIADRLAERIAKLEEERGVDLSNASTLLEKAQGLLDDATAKADEFSDKVPDSITPETAASAAEEMKALRREVDAAIKDARQALIDVIAAIRAGLPPKDQ